MKVFLALTICLVMTQGRVTPDYFPQCKKSDPEINKCIMQAIEVMRPRLREGIPEVHIPALEPFAVPTLKLDRTQPNLRLKAVVKNIRAVGGSNFVVEKLKLNLNNKYAAEVRLSLPHLAVSADYDVRGSRLLVLEIDGKGKLRGNFTGISVIAKGAAKVVEKEGVRYLQADKIVTRVKVGHGQVAFDDTERPLAAASAANFFNASPGVVLDILSPLVDETAAAVLKAFLNKVLAKIPLHEFLLEDDHAPSSYDPAVSKCIERVATAARSVLARGAPALGVQPLEPLRVPSIRLRQHNVPARSFKYDAWLADVTLHGLTDYSFNRLDVYPEELKITTNISLPLLAMFSEYVILGEFQMLPVESTGKMSVNFTAQCTASIEAVGARAHKRLVVRDAAVRLRCAGPLHADLMDAHSSTGEMEMITEHIARMHAGDIAGEVQPALETALAMVLEDVANKFLKHLPADSDQTLAGFSSPTHHARVNQNEMFLAQPIRRNVTGGDVTVPVPARSRHTSATRGKQIERVLHGHGPSDATATPGDKLTDFIITFPLLFISLSEEVLIKQTIFIKMWKIICLFSGVSSVFAAIDKGFVNFGGIVCPREEKALGRCLRDALNAYIPKLATGVPEYGVPACEPLVVGALSVQQAAGPLAVTSSYTNVTVRGPSTMRVKDVQVDSKQHKIVSELYIPELRVTGNYKLSGQLLMLPIEGEGQFSGKYADIDAVVSIALGRAPRRRAPDALTCESLAVKFHIGHAELQLDNLFGGDGELGNAMNKFLNENWQKLAEELQAPLEEALRDFLKPLADHAFGMLRADDVLAP
ncbi:uncharacterized protein LOC134805267 [Cydia splendana]|uniref:uncharacterized protein LOC134805267 n=1 Tax=Cydia splendana TaxID=1100963 RepID=UPI00300D0E57